MTISEFVKCWRSSKKSRLFIDSVNGKAFMNFSVFLGNPSDIHFLSLSVNFSFASPVAEDRTDNAMEGISDPQPSPEDLRQHLEDPPSLTLPHEGESVRENPTEPASENITISEEVLQVNQETASEETMSPGLDRAGDDPFITLDRGLKFLEDLRALSLLTGEMAHGAQEYNRRHGTGL